ncbi:hypothetical protein NLJ89_g2540 [Agrocybe chaxingu]|uniref:non-specific serine/threonine protein kinase n=1 Tax=Agrocybe chaxingu TaxID=84603 RepID=A0A9W8K6D7_9AGAR|nr:hypothetical protein NLJ89_g2540 [Agrocybe chaxingu]
MSLFPEEQLDSPLGYFPVQPGQTLKEGGWTVVRKLGWGPRSSTWLAVDKQEGVDRYGAIKILTVAATEDSTGKIERDIMLGPVKNIQSGVPELLANFYEHDTKGRRHLCLVFRVLGYSVEDLRLSNIYDGEYLPLHTVQKVVGDISERLAQLADQKFVHGAVTADNFLFWSVQAAVDIRKMLAKSPSNKADKIQGSDGIMYPVVKSQPIPNGFRWDSPEEDTMRAVIYLSNYAHARPIGCAGTLDSPKNLLPPEALQGGRVDHKSDIWMLGCTTYLLLTGNVLFSDSYIASPTKTATEALGKLETLLTESEKLAESDISSTASFLRSCLAIKPTNRASAEDILRGGWIKSGYS